MDTVRCPRCQAANDATARFCSQCGVALGGPARPPDGSPDAARVKLVKTMFGELRKTALVVWGFMFVIFLIMVVIWMFMFGPWRAGG
jgi:hypothetical protein